MLSRIKAKILYENQHHDFIVKIETGKFAGLYANVDIDSGNVWLEALWAMFFKWDPYSEWKYWEGQHEEEILRNLNAANPKLMPEVKKCLKDPRYKAECDALNESMLDDI